MIKRRARAPWVKHSKCKESSSFLQRGSFLLLAQESAKSALSLQWAIDSELQPKGVYALYCCTKVIVLFTQAAIFFFPFFSELYELLLL